MNTTGESYSMRLPWPPSVNGYWRRNTHVTYISKEGKAYQRDAEDALIAEYPDGFPHLKGRLALTVELARRDRRKYDIDNHVKALQDVLEGRLYEDDAQIDALFVRRLPVDETGQGYCDVTVTVIEPESEVSDE
jgi:crossover junction endodeoxyribonuclease RusA